MSHLESLESRIEDQMARFARTRAMTEKLCLSLPEEDLLISVTEDTSPLKWHLAHTTWFFENFILKQFQPNYREANAAYGYLFNSYYNGVGEHLAKSKRNILSRPSVADIVAYRRSVTRQVERLMMRVHRNQRHPFEDLLELGIQHEQQHQELILMDIKRDFFENPLRPAYLNRRSRRGPAEESALEWVHRPAEDVLIGHSHRDSSFAYDNEKDEHRYWNEGFLLSSHLVTNREYLDFIEDGGYENALLWLSDGWDYKEKEKWESPLYWEQRDGEWFYMTLSGMERVDWNAPVVHVSYYEAKAFATWRQARLPTESEWEAAAKGERSRGEFFEDGGFQPEPATRDYEVFSQIHGSVWEWTQSAYLPYPRYRPLQYGLAEYNEKFMCNQMVLRGGSSVTPLSHYRPTYRNFYYPQMRWQFAGIRLAKEVIQ